MKRHATISECGTYRYWLERIWMDEEREAPRDFCNWIMLNPSTADAEKDDPTVRKCIEFSRRWGYGGMHVTNLFALRSTDPAALAKSLKCPVGPENNTFTQAGILSAPRTIVSWGSPSGGKAFQALMRRRIEEVWGMLKPSETFALDFTKDGHPRHPLYVPYSAQPQRWAMTRGGGE